MSTRTAVTAFAVLSALGCQIGTSAGGYGPAQGPAGITAELELSELVWSGEVLAVEATSLILRVGAELSRVPYAAIRKGKFKQLGRAGIRNGAFVNPDGQQTLRLVARYPQGVSPALLQSLLETYGQEELTAVGP